MLRGVVISMFINHLGVRLGLSCNQVAGQDDLLVPKRLVVQQVAQGGRPGVLIGVAVPGTSQVAP